MQALQHFDDLMRRIFFIPWYFDDAILTDFRPDVFINIQDDYFTINIALMMMVIRTTIMMTLMMMSMMMSMIHSFINSLIPNIDIALLQVHYYSQALPTTASILCRS